MSLLPRFYLPHDCLHVNLAWRVIDLQVHDFYCSLPSRAGANRCSFPSLPTLRQPHKIGSAWWMQSSTVSLVLPVSGARVSIETCPQYLAFSAEEVPDGATRFKCSPPIRDAANKENLWKALLDGDIDMLNSDRLPSTPDLELFMAPPIHSNSWAQGPTGLSPADVCGIDSKAFADSKRAYGDEEEAANSEGGGSGQGCGYRRWSRMKAACRWESVRTCISSVVLVLFASSEVRCFSVSRSISDEDIMAEIESYLLWKRFPCQDRPKLSLALVMVNQ